MIPPLPTFLVVVPFSRYAFLKKIGVDATASSSFEGIVGTIGGIKPSVLLGLTNSVEGESDSLGADGASEAEVLGDTDELALGESEIPFDGDALPDGLKLALGL